MKHLNFFSKSNSRSMGHRVTTLALTVGSPSAHRRGTMLRLLSVLVLILTIGVGNVWGGNVTGTFTKITSTDALTTGYYVIVASESASTNNKAVGASVDNNKRITGVAVTITSGTTISNPDAATVYLVTKTNSNYTFYNVSTSKYLYQASTTSGKGMGFKDASANITCAGYNSNSPIGFKFTLDGASNNYFKWNNSSSWFANYANDYSTTMAPVRMYKAYKVTYDGNGKTGGTVPTDATYYSGNGSTVVTTKTNSGSLVKTGYTFAGWNTKANGAGTHYAAGGTFTISANTTLYAEWESADCANNVNITKGSESHGTFTLSESGPQATCSGLSVVVTPNADDHYHVGSVSATTGETGTDNGDGTWTITYAADVTGSSTINVVFAEDNKYTLNYHDGSGDDTKTNVYEGTNLITALGTPAASCDATSTAFQGWSTTEIATKTNTPPTFVAANAVVNSTTAAATYYAVYAKQGELESVAGGDIASDFGTTGLEGSHSEFYSENGFKFKAVNNYVTTGDISSNNYKDVTVKLKAGYNGSSGSILTIASLDKDGNTIDSETLTPSEAYTSQSTTYTFELSGSKVIKEVRVTMTSKTNNLGMKYCEVFHSSLSDYLTTCCTSLGSINGSFFWPTHFCPAWPAKHRS